MRQMFEGWTNIDYFPIFTKIDGLFCLEVQKKNAGFQGKIHYKDLLLHNCWELESEKITETLNNRLEIIKKVYDVLYLRILAKELKIKIDYEIFTVFMTPSGHIFARRYYEWDGKLSNYLGDNVSKLDWDSIFMYEQKIEILEENQ